jgi:hypothetical protein
MPDGENHCHRQQNGQKVSQGEIGKFHRIAFAEEIDEKVLHVNASRTVFRQADISTIAY